MVVETENVRLQLRFLAFKGKGDARDMNSNPHPSIRHDPASPTLVSQTSYAPKMESLTLLEQSMETSVQSVGLPNLTLMEIHCTIIISSLVSKGISPIVYQTIVIEKIVLFSIVVIELRRR